MCSEAKWTDASKWVKAQLARTSNSKYRPSEKQKPNATVAQANKKLAARGFYQLKTGHCLTGQYLQWTTRRPDAKCWWRNYKSQTREHLFKICPQWKSQQKALLAVAREETGRGKDRFKISELFADESYSKAILDFLATAEVGRAAGPPVVDEEPGRERKGYLAQAAEEEGVGRGGGRLWGGGIIDYLFSLSLFRFSFIRQPSKDGGGQRNNLKGCSSMVWMRAVCLRQ